MARTSKTVWSSCSSKASRMLRDVPTEMPRVHMPVVSRGELIFCACVLIVATNNLFLFQDKPGYSGQAGVHGCIQGSNDGIQGHSPGRRPGFHNSQPCTGKVPQAKGTGGRCITEGNATKGSEHCIRGPRSAKIHSSKVG